MNLVTLILATSILLGNTAPDPRIEKARSILEDNLVDYAGAKVRKAVIVDTGVAVTICADVNSPNRLGGRPDSALVTFGFGDAYNLGVLSSRIHVIWVLATGGTLETRPRYNKRTCFDPFPFPADVSEPTKRSIRTEAEALDALRKRVVTEHEDLTLTKLYNVLEALREGRALTEVERDMHDRGLVTLIRQHHDRIDALVAEAYGWPADLPEEEILNRLVALNRVRTAEETKGQVRWLRPEFQAPDYQSPITQTLDLGEAPTAVVDNVIPWPGTLPEQVSAIQSVLAASPTPLAPQDVARAFKGKRASTVRPVLDALAGIGMARRLADGRYAA